MRSLLLVLLLSLALVGFPSQAWAHQVETNYMLGSQLQFQSRFSTGEPFAGARVTIYAPNQPDQPWQTLTTDSQGQFSFLPDRTIVGNWEVRIEDEDQSHADYWTVPVDGQGIVEEGIVLDATQDQHYVTASVLTPLVTSIAAALGWALLKRRRPQV
jgi:nickel transport protein